MRDHCLSRNVLGAALVAGLVALAAVSDAQAEIHSGVAASAGHAFPNADESCFEHYGTRMTNNCSSGKKLVIVLPPAQQPASFVWVTAINAPANTLSTGAPKPVLSTGTGLNPNMRCRVLFEDALAGVSIASPFQDVPAALTRLSFAMPTLSRFDGVQVECDVPAARTVYAAGYGS
jgi:hypothetical protein